MKIKKILSGVAAATVAATTIATAASATLTVVENGDPGLISGTDMWLVQVYNIGSAEENKPATDYGIDCSAVSAVEIFIKAAEPEWWDGMTGGGVVLSVNGGDIAKGTALWDTYNWCQKEFWGVTDEEALPDASTAAKDKPVVAEKVGDYTYKLHLDVVNPLAVEADVDEIGCMQVALKEWGSSLSDVTVVGCKVLDGSGNVMISYDANGVATVGGGKGSPDTGVEGVAAAAGLAVVAGGALLLSKKRK